MMGRALVSLGILATLGLVATGVLGYLVDGREYLSLHQVLGLLSSLLLLFSHCWIMFYLIGTGKAIKEAVAEHGLDEELSERTKTFKNRSYPPLMLAIGLVMAVFIVGGGVDTGKVPAWVHQALFLLALYAQFKALWTEHRVLEENRTMMGDIDRQLTRQPAAE